MHKYVGLISTVVNRYSNYSLFSEKKHPLMFSIITWSIYIPVLFVPVERGITTLLTYSLDDVITASHCTSQKFTS